MPKKPVKKATVKVRNTAAKKQSASVKKTPTAAKTPASKKAKKTPLQLVRAFFAAVGGWFVRVYKRSRTKLRLYMQRRPHRSFKPTRRRDYKRSLKLPGYFTFTLDVTALLWRNKAIFIWMTIVYVVLVIVFGLMGSQQIFGQLRELMTQTAPDSIFSGVAGEVGKAGVLLFAIMTSGITGTLEPLQIVIASFLALYVWLTSVWVLRRIVAGNKVKLRDGLYSAGSPILPTFLVIIILLIQLVPAAAAMIVAGAAWQSGIIEGGAISMLVGTGLALIVVLSLYWAVSTFVALVVVTLPGVYPMQAITIAGDLVIGRRLRVLLRVLWMLFVLVSWWVVLMVPLILFDGWIKSVFEQIEWLPIVPFALLLLSTFSIIWSSIYIYLLYRNMVDDDVSPA